MNRELKEFDGHSYILNQQNSNQTYKLSKFISTLQGILLCAFTLIVSAQDRHTREHQHQHHRHHNGNQRQKQQQHNVIKIENIHGNKTFGGHAWFSGGHSISETIENEQLEKKSGKNGWSGWTNWSTCSRSCDGGIAQQIRRCHSTHCRGEPIRYRICNMQVNYFPLRNIKTKISQ